MSGDKHWLDACAAALHPHWQPDGRQTYIANQLPDMIRTLTAERDHLREQLAARAWQPIETAPIDEGRHLLAYVPHEHDFGGGTTVVVRYGGHWCDLAGFVRPTHWQPLPPAPGAVEEE